MVLNVSVAGDGRYAFLTEGSTAESDEIGWLDARVHVLELGTGPTPSLGAPLQSLSPSRDAAYRIVRVSGRLLTVLTDRGAPRHRLVEIDLDQPAPAHGREVIPESPHVLQSVRMIGGRFAAIYLRDAQQYVKVFTLTGAPVRDIEAPPVSRVFVEAGAADSLLEVESEGYLQLPTVIQYDVTNGSTTPVFSAKSAFPMHEFLASQVWYTSRDGTRIPMFLVHRKGIALNGTHPTLLFGYGASGTSTLPGYSPDVLTWLQMGGVFAVPTMRGGGEFGRDWYESAALERKQKTFDDFIGAAEYLIAQGYTTAARLAIKGESNGGQLVAAVMVQRPELFAVAVPGVPQTDNLRYDRGRHRGQFGSPADFRQFSFLYAYSPLHQVRAGTCYPATLVTTAMNDDRSPAWMSMKFVAALQAAQACPRPVVLLARERGGHFGERTPDGAIQDAADVLLFIAKQLGMSQPPR